METRPDVSNPWPGAPLHVKESTASTMEDAAALARDGCPSGTVIAAGYQSAGRGRVPGRQWVSPPGESLLATVVIRIAELGYPLAELPLRAGVALCRGVEDASGVSALIKWPNDLLCAGKKLAGLLCETRGDAALIGFGVNCLQASFPPELRETSCSLRQLTGNPVAVFSLLGAILARLKGVATDSAWREELRARLHGLGSMVSVDLLGSGRTVEGILCDVDGEGRLVLRLPDGSRQAVAQGEISRRR
jgi:BirA family transcriptional regulator, biotin operon repressor / biotin---[acetyl-CoA-carboxylase] ligase